MRSNRGGATPHILVRRPISWSSYLMIMVSTLRHVDVNMFSQEAN